MNKRISFKRVWGMRAADLPKIDVRMPVEMQVQMADLAVRACHFANRFITVITDEAHRDFVREAAADDYIMPDFAALLPELDVMRRIATSFDPHACQPFQFCDAFVEVPMKTAFGYALSYLHAARLCHAMVNTVGASDYIAYHRQRAEDGEGYQGPSAVSEWNEFYKVTGRLKEQAAQLYALLSDLAPQVTNALPRREIYVNHPLTPGGPSGRCVLQ